jgi:mRNA-degrading endonuclease HigB of HigAB toxin-antitoxin module
VKRLFLSLFFVERKLAWLQITGRVFRILVKIAYETCTVGLVYFPVLA